jgi:Permuted papain-like amidase enzyme, YaeF/YiiX, C92 family
MANQIKSKTALEKIHPRNADENNLHFYEKMRSEFETGDLLFFSGNHWLSSLIRWRSKSAWSHVGMVIKIEELDRLFLVESVIESGVRLLPLSFVFKDYGGDYKSYNGRVAWAKHDKFMAKRETKHALREFCMDNLSKQYDRKEYWRILWRSFMGREKFFEDDKYTCAEFVYEAYKYANVELPKEKGVFISPGAFWRQKDLELKAILI